MADGLHEISQAIGRLQASDESSQRQRAELFNQVAALREDMHRSVREIRDLLAPLPLHIKRHCEDLEALSARATMVQSWIDKAKGASWATKTMWAAFVALCTAGSGVIAYSVSAENAKNEARALKQEIEVLDRRQKAYLPRSLVGPQ